ncbi:MAG: metallophosphoesterase [Candidatus Hydrogenedens sp.]|nr:metallophosphoesterase [Candidatus Hydrogenedens sp.]
MRINRIIILIVSCLVCMPAAHARQEDGSLGLIRVPNNGRPVIATAGDAFEIILLEEAQLHLEREGLVFPLETNWRESRGKRVYGEATLPADLPAGCYSLCGKNSEIQDVNLRSVYIVEALKESYAFAHITDMHTGTTRHKRSDREILLELLGQVNESDADFSLITGDVTDHGTAEEFLSLLEILDTSRIPTFLAPGNHDRTDSNYADFFEHLTYAFQYGRDGYLSFDTKDYLIADEMNVQNSLLYLYRRELRPSRWSVGMTHRYDPDMGMRSQLTLFVDDPLDYLLVGHTHREARTGDQIPWGKTRLIMTPAAINGSWRLVRVDDQGLHQEATVTTVSITPPEPEEKDEEEEKKGNQ